MDTHTQPAVAVTEPAAVTELSPEVPAGIRRARAAFLRDFEKLHADRKTRDKYVAYHFDDLVAVDAQYRRLVDKMYGSGIPEEEWLVILVTPASRAEEQLFAEEGEINPD